MMGIWAFPTTIDDAKKLSEVMSSPIPANKAAEVLYNVVGDDTLFDMIDEAKTIAKDADVRSVVAYTIFGYNYFSSEKEWSPPRQNGVREIFDEIIDEHLFKGSEDRAILHIAKFKDQDVALKHVSDVFEIPIEKLTVTATPFFGAYVIEDHEGTLYNFDSVYGLVNDIPAELIDDYRARTLSKGPCPL